MKTLLLAFLLIFSIAPFARAEETSEWCAPTVSDLSVACVVKDPVTGQNLLYATPCMLGERGLIRGMVKAVCPYDTVTITATPHDPEQGFPVQPAKPRRKRFETLEGGTLPFAIVVDPYFNFEAGVVEIPIVIGASSSYDSDRSKTTLMVPWDSGWQEF